MFPLWHFTNIFLIVRYEFICKTFQGNQHCRCSAVRGKNSSLGEIFSQLSSKGIPVPDGFATTASAFEEFLIHNLLHSRLYDLMQQLDKKNYSNLKEKGSKARKLMLDAELLKNFQSTIVHAYKEL